MFKIISKNEYIRLFEEYKLTNTFTMDDLLLNNSENEIHAIYDSNDLSDYPILARIKSNGLTTVNYSELISDKSLRNELIKILTYEINNITLYIDIKEFCGYIEGLYSYPGVYRDYTVLMDHTEFSNLVSIILKLKKYESLYKEYMMILLTHKINIITNGSILRICNRKEYRGNEQLDNKISPDKLPNLYLSFTSIVNYYENKI